jgi:hypothetical protein
MDISDIDSHYLPEDSDCSDNGGEEDACKS